MNKIIDAAKKYKELNEYAEKFQVVVFGDGYLDDFPYYDLMQGRITDYAVYNRSMSDLTVGEAINVVDYCLYHLAPQTLLLHFEPSVQDDGFREKYLVLIRKIRSFYKKCSIGLLETSDQKGDVIERIAGAARCNYLFIPKEWDSLRSFHKMDAFFRGGEISFYDAFSI